VNDGPLGKAVRHLRTLAGGRAGDGVSDSQLLRLYAARRDEAAFAAVVRRHGPLVLGVCRRLLRGRPEAEDAFQGTFLVLARKAGCREWGESVAGWLCAVARRVALKARTALARRTVRQQEMPDNLPGPEPEDGADREATELAAVVVEELGQLPEKYRTPLVLCYLQGKSNEEVARELGRPVGTVWYWLSQGRELLRRRLVRRGLAPSAVALTAALSRPATAAVPEALFVSLTQTAANAAHTTTAAGAAATAAAVLAKEVLRDMASIKWKVTMALAAVCVIGLGMAAFQRTPAADPNAPKEKEAPQPAQQSREEKKGKGANDAKADVPGLVKGNNAFALELYGRLRDKPGNLILSPYSISTALAMTSAGARGTTLEQMTKTLHLPDQATLHPSAAALIRRVHGDGKNRDCHLITANALWGQQDYGFVPAFLDLTRDHYGAGLREVDFIKDTEGARKAINDWVERETQGKIKELLAKDKLDGDDRLVLTNTIYFKGAWANPFKKKDTKDEAFVLAGGDKIKTPMMSQEMSVGYHDGHEFAVVELPYAGKQLSMVVFLPKKADGLPALEKSLSADSLAAVIGKLRQEEVHVSLPRFKTTTDFSLKQPLSDMGMSLAFKGLADFSGMSSESKPPLYIKDVVHKAFVEVNEEATEATGATGVIIKKVSLPPAFIANHPFLFLIRDRGTGSILFLGRVSDPR
jgi:serpin B